MKMETSSLYSLLFQLLNKKSIFEVLHSDINSPKSGLLQLASLRVDQQKSKIALETKVSGTISLIDTVIILYQKLLSK
jgi:hypothetical protein